jgi:dTDP-4-dehydrorhamnose 3,5-epimerase
MNVIKTELPGVLILEPKMFGDFREFFVEHYQAEKYSAHSVGPFVQDNLSRSSRGVLRGLHLQDHNSQGKLVSVMRGNIWTSRSMSVPAVQHSASLYHLPRFERA